MKKNSFKILSIIVFIAAMALLTVIAIPLIRTYNKPEAFAQYVESLGAGGFIMMFFIQIAQVIVAIIPGEVVEFVAGTLYGWFGGMLFCLAGILVGQAVIFQAVRFFGKNLVEKIAGSEKINKYKFLHDKRKRNIMLFILFFIPGTPKDLLTYIVPLTDISMNDFLVISLFARIPTVVSSTYGGDAFADKNFIMLAIVYISIAIFSISGAVLYRLWDIHREKKNSKSDAQ